MHCLTWTSGTTGHKILHCILLIHTSTKLVCLASLTVTTAWTSSINFCFSSSSNCMYHLASRVFPARFWMRMKRIYVMEIKKKKKRHLLLKSQLRKLSEMPNIFQKRIAILNIYYQVYLHLFGIYLPLYDYDNSLNKPGSISFSTLLR